MSRHFGIFWSCKLIVILRRKAAPEERINKRLQKKGGAKVKGVGIATNLPQGFFDDKTKDANIRGVETPADKEKRQAPFQPIVFTKSFHKSIRNKNGVVSKTIITLWGKLKMTINFSLKNFISMIWKI